MIVRKNYREARNACTIKNPDKLMAVIVIIKIHRSIYMQMKQYVVGNNCMFL